jgi:hypothetical protein
VLQTQNGTQLSRHGTHKQTLIHQLSFLLVHPANVQSFSELLLELMRLQELHSRLGNASHVLLDVLRVLILLHLGLFLRRLNVIHVLTDITIRRLTNCATKLKTAKVTSINIKILALNVMIYVQIASKVILITEVLTLLLPLLPEPYHFAISVSIKQNLKPCPLAQRPNLNAFANLGRNPLLKQLLQLTE